MDEQPALTDPAGASGLLAYADDANVPTAVLTGCAAFSGAVLLQLTLLNFAWDK